MSSDIFTKTISFIGGGRLTYLLLNRLDKAKIFSGNIIVCDPSLENLKKISISFRGNLTTSTDNIEAISADLIFLAVHPPVVNDVLEKLTDKPGRKSILISLVPTKSIQYLANHLNGFNRIVRMIPNAPSIIGAGYNPVSSSRAITSPEKIDLQKLFEIWGKSPEVPEKHLEAYAILTGMGPTYFWFQYREMHKLAGEFGLNNADAEKAIYNMLKGSNEVLYQSGISKDEVLDLIPVYPLKEKESDIRNIFNDKLHALFDKLCQATK